MTTRPLHPETITEPCGDCGRPVPIPPSTGGDDAEVRESRGVCPWCAVAQQRRREAETRQLVREWHRRGLGLQPLTRSRHRAHWAIESALESLTDIIRFASPEDARTAERALELVAAARARLQATGVPPGRGR